MTAARSFKLYVLMAGGPGGDLARLPQSAWWQVLISDVVIVPLTPLADCMAGVVSRLKYLTIRYKTTLFMICSG